MKAHKINSPHKNPVYPPSKNTNAHGVSQKPPYQNQRNVSPTVRSFQERFHYPATCKHLDTVLRKICQTSHQDNRQILKGRNPRITREEAGVYLSCFHCRIKLELFSNEHQSLCQESPELKDIQRGVVLAELYGKGN